MEFEVESMTQLEKLHWMVDTHGWGVEPVKPIDNPARPRAGYSYTFGIESLIGRPELMMFGLAPSAARGLMELVVTHLRSGAALPTGEAFVGLLDGDLRAVMLPVDLADHRHLFPTLRLLYGDQPYRVNQFVWPDRNGSLPWEPDWPHHLRLAQPVLST
jgi:hypothetical protein